MILALALFIPFSCSSVDPELARFPDRATCEWALELNDRARAYNALFIHRFDTRTEAFTRQVLLDEIHYKWEVLLYIHKGYYQVETLEYTLTPAEFATGQLPSPFPVQHE